MSFILNILLQLAGAVAAIVVITFVAIATLGVLNRARCAKCGQPQPIVRRPLNERQALWGGYTCRQCGTELDSSGQPISN
jgi:predicted SprT family Zn-dependent metalloprotease